MAGPPFSFGTEHAQWHLARESTVAPAGCAVNGLMHATFILIEESAAPSRGRTRKSCHCVLWACIASGSVTCMDEAAHLLTTRATYDTMAADYARLLPDLRAEASSYRHSCCGQRRVGNGGRRPVSLPLRP